MEHGSPKLSFKNDDIRLETLNASNLVRCSWRRRGGGYAVYLLTSWCPYPSSPSSLVKLTMEILRVPWLSSNSFMQKGTKGTHLNPTPSADKKFQLHFNITSISHVLSNSLSWTSSSHVQVLHLFFGMSGW